MEEHVKTMKTVSLVHCTDKFEGSTCEEKGLSI